MRYSMEASMMQSQYFKAKHKKSYDILHCIMKLNVVNCNSLSTFGSCQTWSRDNLAALCLTPDALPKEMIVSINRLDFIIWYST